MKSSTVLTLILLAFGSIFNAVLASGNESIPLTKSTFSVHLGDSLSFSDSSIDENVTNFNWYYEMHVVIPEEKPNSHSFKVKTFDIGYKVTLRHNQDGWTSYNISRSRITGYSYFNGRKYPQIAVTKLDGKFTGNHHVLTFPPSVEFNTKRFLFIKFLSKRSLPEENIVIDRNDS